MALVEVNWNPDRRQLRLFGVGGLVILSIVAILLHWLKGLPASWAFVLAAAGLAIFVASLTSPGLARLIYVAMTAVTLPLGIVISFALLAAFYYLILTPVGLLFRVIGRDPLRRKFDRSAATYWIAHRPTETSDRYFHQF